MLGLCLGLSPRTLDIIRANNIGDTWQCLTACLNGWLKQVDDVHSNGGPTIHSLVCALRKIGVNAVADGIDKESSYNVSIF